MSSLRELVIFIRFYFSFCEMLNLFSWLFTRVWSLSLVSEIDNRFLLLLQNHINLLSVRYSGESKIMNLYLRNNESDHDYHDTSLADMDWSQIVTVHHYVNLSVLIIDFTCTMTCLIKFQRIYWSEQCSVCFWMIQLKSVLNFDWLNFLSIKIISSKEYY